MNQYKRYFEYICGLPKSIYINFKYFPLPIAIKLPILVSNNVLLYNLKGNIKLDCKQVKTGMIKFGFGYVGIFDRHRSKSILENAGTLIFKGTASIGHGFKISISKEAYLTLGNEFCLTAESQICSKKNICIGDNVLISWQCLIMDTDWHKIYANNQYVNEDNNIKIGNKVWIGCRATILKGVNIPEECVIAANSHVVHSFQNRNVIIGGNPAKIIKQNITWEG